MRCCVRYSIVPFLLYFLHTPLFAQTAWEDVYPAPIRASGLTTFGDSLIAWFDGVLRVAGGDGLEWRPLDKSAATGSVFAFDGTRLYMSGGFGGLFVRNPGDEDFHILNTELLPPLDLLCVGDSLYLHTYEALYRSTNGGASFEHIHQASFRSLLFHDGTAFYALFDRDSLRRSEDGGITWSPCSAPHWTSRYGEWSYVLHRNSIYAAGYEMPWLRRSTDGGRSWASLPSLPVDSFPRVPTRSVTAITASDEALVISTERGIFRSTDEGSSWIPLSIGSIGCSALFTAQNCLLANNASGTYRYDSSMKQWRQVEFSHLSQYGISLVACGRYLAGDLNRFSPDEGDSWWAQGKGNRKIAARSDGILLRVQQGALYQDSSRLESSTDNGRSWVFLDSLVPGPHDVAANETLILLGSPWYVSLGIIYTLRLSTDGGAYWNDLLTLPVAESAPRELYLNRRGDILFFSLPHSVFSSDVGKQWDTLRTPAGDSLLAAVLTENSLYLQSASGIWQRQADGSMRATQLTERISAARIVGKWEDHVCVLGRDSLYFVHDIDGRLRGVPIPDMLVGLSYTPHFASSTNCVFLTSGSSTMFRLRLHGLLDVPHTEAVPAGITVLGVHPHPLTNNGCLRVTAVHAGDTDIDILDLLGRVRGHVHNGHLAVGEHALSISVPDLAAGCYLLRLRSGRETRFHPLIVGR